MSDIAWAAGFLDGEGSFQLNAGSNYKLRPYVSAAQAKRKASLEKLQSIFGGSICEVGTRTKAGNKVYVWTLRSAAVIRDKFPEMIEHMTDRKEEAALILEFASRMKVRGETAWPNRTMPPEEVAAREAIQQKLKEIRRR